MDIVSKQTGDELTATEFNQIPTELENVITKAGLVPSENSLDQVAQSITQFCADADFYTTSGTANAIELNPVAPRVAPTELTDGFRVRFIAGNTNTGSVTLNVAGLGAKDLILNGFVLAENSIYAGKIYEATYNQSQDKFYLNVGYSDNHFLQQHSSNYVLNASQGSVLTHSGNTFTVKRGVTVVYPNGLKPDLSYNNGVFTTTEEISMNLREDQFGSYAVFMNCETGNIDYIFTGRLLISAHQPTGLSSDFYLWYDLQNNIFKAWEAGAWVTKPYVILGYFYLVSGNVTLFQPNKTVRYLTFDDIKENLSANFAPSNAVRENVTLASSGTQYVAPDNGWVSFGKLSNGAGQYVGAGTSGNMYTSVFSSQANQNLRVFFPIKRNHKFTITYTAGGATEFFYFMYAQGCEP